MHKNRNTVFPVVPEGSSLEVLKIAEKAGYFTCKCVCGTVWDVRQDAIRKGNAKSCGCLKNQLVSEARTVHGASKTSEHNVWWSMLARCYTEGDNPRPDYAGAGITVCDRWKEPNGQGFLNFMADMGPRPSPKHQVDRYPDGKGNYEPGNCRWATPAQQARHRKSNIDITYNGRTQCLQDWAVEVGMTGGALYYRIKKWGLEKAMTAPKNLKKVGRPKNANSTPAT